MKRTLFAAAALVLAGCLGSTDLSPGFTIPYDFNVLKDGWVAASADYPADQAAAVGFVGDVRNLPAPLLTTSVGLYLSGTNVSGDLFMYQLRYVTGFPANTTYNATLQVEYSTNIHSGCTDGPGPVTFIKAGVTSTQPVVTADAQGVLRLNIDKGAGASGGVFTQLGDITSGLAGCPTPGTYSAWGTPIRSQSMPVVTDASGGFFIFLGTQSSFVGFHEIYFTRMNLTLE
jgi:hypothetical protein